MYEEMVELIPNQGWGKPKSYRSRYGRSQADQAEAGFRCRHCQAYVHTLPVLSGVQNRNHCPFCLWSRHLDLLQAGDRLSACKANMQPIGLTMKKTQDKYGVERFGELMVIHRCSECDRVSINRIAGDDLAEAVEGIFRASFGLDTPTRQQLDAGGIHLLQAGDVYMVVSQLFGQSQN
jgi:RNHCP domain